MEVRRTWLVRPIMVVMEEVWDYLVDDSPLRFEAYEPRLSNDSRWYVSTEGDDIVGAYWARRLNWVTWEVHANVRPKYWGDKNGTKHCKAALDLIFEDTGAQKIVATIPDSSPVVQDTAEAIGFRREGVMTLSFQKEGKLYDQTHFGITRQ